MCLIIFCVCVYVRDKERGPEAYHTKDVNEKFIWILGVTVNMFCTHNLFPLSPMLMRVFFSFSLFCRFFFWVGWAHVCLTLVRFTLKTRVPCHLCFVACHCLPVLPGIFHFFSAVHIPSTTKKNGRRRRRRKKRKREKCYKMNWWEDMR